MNKGYKSGDTLTVRIKKIVPRGYGLAFTNGLTTLTALAAVGDKVRVRLDVIKGKMAFAEIEEILEPSPHRVDPPCEYFGSCGGCDFQQMDIAAQLEAKKAMIRDCLHRIAKIDLDGDIHIISSPEEFGYRLRVQWHVDVGVRKIGYYRRNSRDLIDIKRCRILAPELQSKLDELRDSLPWEKFAGRTARIDAACGDDGQVSVWSSELVEATAEISIAAAGERFSFSARSFFQGNKYLVDQLIAAAIGDAGGGTALDLYCGVGLFTIPLARRFERVIGVEENEQAIDLADRNADNARLGNVEFYAESVRDFLAAGVVGKVDFVLLDPPRAGTEKDAMYNLIKLSPKNITYVACEPSILARDLRRFVENGYVLDSITAIDLFPQTHHVETIAKLRLG